MSVGLLIITHGQIGRALLDTTTSMLGLCPLRTEVLNVSQDADPQALVDAAKRLVKTLDQGEGVLVLTDMYGATPGNVANALCSERAAVIAGLNLPMLVRVLNYAQLPLVELTQKALSGGREGVLPVSAAGA